MGRIKVWKGRDRGRGKDWKEEGIRDDGIVMRGRSNCDAGRQDLEDGMTGFNAAPSAAFPRLCRRCCSPLLAAIVVDACNNGESRGDSRRKGIP